MKKMWIIGIIAALSCAGLVARAADDQADKKDAPMCSKMSCAKALAGITLTADQQAKVDAIEAACDGTMASCMKAKDSIRAVLTEDQQKAFDANAAKAPKGRCCEEKGSA